MEVNEGASYSFDLISFSVALPPSLLFSTVQLLPFACFSKSCLNLLILLCQVYHKILSV